MKPTQEQVIAWARKYGDWNGQTVEMNDVGLEAAYAAAYEAGRKDENEECGKICDAAQLFGNSDERWAAKCCADQIRRRREQ